MWEYLKTVQKPIVLYGMGNNADRVLNRLNELNINVSGVFASDGFVRGHSFRNFEVTDYKTACERFGDMIVLLCFGSQLEDVMNNIKRIAAEQELYVPDMPVAGETIFDSDFVREHSARLEAVCKRLCDEQSKKVFNSVVKFKTSGALAPLLSCETTENEAFENIIKPQNDEIMVDLGAYTGDTVHGFLKYGGCSRVYAVEPDAKNFKKLVKNTEDLGFCTCINAAVGSSEGTVEFCAKSGRNSAIGKGGSIIRRVSVDSLLQDEPVTYIKMDVEGAEGDAIGGARQSILKYKPKMLISCYHRSEDLYDIAERVLAIRDDYKIYMRHYPYIPAWDTAFYFV